LYSSVNNVRVIEGEGRRDGLGMYHALRDEKTTYLTKQPTNQPTNQPEASLPCSKESVSSPCSEQDESSQQHHHISLRSTLAARNGYEFWIHW